jgi:hypothetical protein
MSLGPFPWAGRCLWPGVDLRGGAGLWTCVAPWVVAGDVAHPRSITSNLITGAIATLLALAAASAARDHTDNRRSSTGNYNDRRTRSQGREDR